LREHRRVLGARPRATDLVTGLQAVLGPAIAAEQVHGFDFQSPVLAVMIQFDVGMRIGPYELGDDAADGGRLGHIESGGGVMRQEREGARYQNGNGLH